MYNERIMKEFTKPKNMGEMKNPDAIGKAGNPVCGDVMEIYLKIEKKDNKEYIKDIKMKTFGCVVAIANASVLTQLVKGKSLEEAEKIDNKDILAQLGEVPPIKIHCSFLAIDALKDAINNYKKQRSENK
ncbi:MAG: iron-sulfur cluster assembly scaffold protein [Candidatus Diapherotrites archaeon]|nr:iron-sulfur cluster assembly scaffold protein [Candidatus Diapherotrites archaeon]